MHYRKRPVQAKAKAISASEGYRDQLFLAMAALTSVFFALLLKL
jgi:hypothetical protein